MQRWRVKVLVESTAADDAKTSTLSALIKIGDLFGVLDSKETIHTTLSGLVGIYVATVFPQHGQCAIQGGRIPT